MSMLNEKEVRALIVMRVQACCESCNSSHINHVDGQIRALVAVLTGQKPPVFGYQGFGDTAAIYEAAGIPFTRGEFNGEDAILISDEWLEEHDMTADSDGKVTHKYLKGYW